MPILAYNRRFTLIFYTDIFTGFVMIYSESGLSIGR